MLKLDWFIETPIDFEHKNYILLHYISEIDNSYANHNLNPYLLWTEKLVNELSIFKENFELFSKSLKKDIIGFSFFSGIKYSEVSIPEKVDEIFEIVDYSKPILESKIKIGYLLHKKYPQILY
jgi:hypothetical protein